MNLKTLHKNLTGWKTNNQAVRVVTALTAAAVTMMITVTCLCAIGFFADRYFGYKALFTGIGAFCGVVTGFLIVLQQIEKFYRQPIDTDS